MALLRLAKVTIGGVLRVIGLRPVDPDGTSGYNTANYNTSGYGD